MEVACSKGVGVDSDLQGALEGTEDPCGGDPSQVGGHLDPTKVHRLAEVGSFNYYYDFNIDLNFKAQSVRLCSEDTYLTCEGEADPLDDFEPLQVPPVPLSASFPVRPGLFCSWTPALPVRGNPA